jgi:RNA polymerase sigma factor (sigma-70 family)
MAEERSFHDLLCAVRTKDQAAEQELFQRFGPVIRRLARVLLVQAHLQHLWEASDVLQEVMKSFFGRIEDYELATENDLRRLLKQIARHKVCDHNRQERAQCRDPGPQAAGAVSSLADRKACDPQEIVATRELFQRCWQKLDEFEQQLFELWQENKTWEEIGRELEGSPEALRKQLERARERVRRELATEEALS